MYPSFDMLDLRKIAPEFRVLIIEVHALQVEEAGSFWMIDDHDPVEIYDFLTALVYCVQTCIHTNKGYRIFLGKTRSIASVTPV